jgi:hypothetical protein
MLLSRKPHDRWQVLQTLESLVNTLLKEEQTLLAAKQPTYAAALLGSVKSLEFAHKEKKTFDDIWGSTKRINHEICSWDCADPCAIQTDRSSLRGALNDIDESHKSCIDCVDSLQLNFDGGRRRASGATLLENPSETGQSKASSSGSRSRDPSPFR